MTSGTCRCVLVRAFGILAIVLPTVVVIPSQAQTFSVLHNFNTSVQPHGNLVRDGAGNLYGIQGYTVFKLDTAGTMTSLSTFSPDPLHGGFIYGTGLNSNLMMDPAGNLYGTTPQGGLVHCFLTGPGLPIEDAGCGTVFKLDPSGHKTVLYNFGGGNTGPDGAFASSGLIRDAAGNLYGSTDHGGAYDCSVPLVIALGCGTVFKLDTSGTETILFNALASPSVIDAAGNLYGVRGQSIFKLDKSGNYKDLYGFTSGTDGGNPQGSLAMDGAGNLYGTTNIGGLSSCVTAGATIGCGVVFKLDPSGKLTVLYTFTGGSNDGANPNSGMVLDSVGNLYGTTSHGGPADVGTVFKLNPTGTETVLYNFAGGTDGGSPDPGLVLDTSGNLYGSTTSGGDLSCGTGGCGVIFKIAPVTPDFSLSASAFSPTKISPGGSSTSTLSLTAVAGFIGSINLSCSVQPSPAQAPQCSISPGSTTAGTPATLTVTTTAPNRASLSSSSSALFYALWLPLIGGIAVRACGQKRKRRAAALVLGSALIAGVSFQAACGGGSTVTDVGGSRGTPAGTYTVTVTGTDSSGSLQHSTTTTVTVQ